MQRLLITVLLAALSCSTFAQSQAWQWARRGGSQASGMQAYGPSEDLDDIVTDKQGNVYVVAHHFNLNIDVAGYQFPTTGDDRISMICISSFKCDGSLRWMKMMYGCDGLGRSIKVDTLGGVYITGYANNVGNHGTCTLEDATQVDTALGQWPYPINRSWFLLKLDTAGAYKWIRFPQPDTATIHSNNSGVFDMDVDPDGTSYMLGSVSNGAYAGGAFIVNHAGGWGAYQNQELYMFKYNSSGTFQSGYHFPFHFVGHINPDARITRDSKRHRSIIYGLNGEYPGDSLWINNQFVPSIFVAAFDDTGSMQWLRIQDSAGQGGLFGSCSNRATLDKDGNIYIAAWCDNGFSFNGTVIPNAGYNGAAVIKMDTAGHNIWVQHSDNSGTVNAAQVAVCGDTVGVFGMYATQMMAWGTDTLTREMNCGYRAYFTRLKAGTGAVIAVDSLWAPCGFNIFPGNGGGMAGGNTGVIASDPFGNFYMGGQFDHELATGPDTVYNIGGDFNWYVCKFGSTNCSQPVVTSVAQKVTTTDIDLKVFPNPSDGYFTFSGNAALGHLSVCDITGRCVYSEMIGTSKAGVDLGMLAGGVYVYTIQSPSGAVIRGKLVLR